MRINPQPLTQAVPEKLITVSREPDNLEATEQCRTLPVSDEGTCAKQSTKSTRGLVRRRPSPIREHKSPEAAPLSKNESKRKAVSQELRGEPIRKKPKRPMDKSAVLPSSIKEESTSILARRTCAICLENKDFIEFPNPSDLPARCIHCLDICSACICNSITSAIMYRAIDKVGCPQCDRPWKRPFIKQHALRDSFAHFEGLELMHVVEAMPNYRPCLGSDCTSGQVCELEDAAPIIKCQDCGHRSCFTHRVPWHTGMTCAEYDILAETTLETQRRIEQEEKETKRIVRSCPSCRVGIKKDGGCDHMSCTYLSHAMIMSC